MAHSSAQNNENDDESELFAVDRVEFLEEGGSMPSTNVLKALAALKGMERNDIKSRLYKRLLKIVENILLNPWDKQKRRIRKTNPVYEQHIATHQEALELFDSIGFNDINGFAVMSVVNVPLLRGLYRKLISMLHEEYGIEVKSLEGHFFDPFKPYKHSANIGKNVDIDNFEITMTDITKKQMEEIHRKLSDVDMDTTLSSWNPRIYMENKPKRAPRRDKDAQKDSPDIQPTVSHVMQIYKVGKCDQFESTSKKNLDALKKQCEHLEKRQTVELKIKLPGGAVLIIDPPMKTPIAKLKSEIQSIMVDSISPGSWDLLEVPTRRVLDSSKTLIQEDITHKVVLHFLLKGK